MLAALEWQRKTEDWTKENGKYIVYPERWLKRRKWEDEPPSANQPSAQDSTSVIKRPSCPENLEKNAPPMGPPMRQGGTPEVHA